MKREVLISVLLGFFTGSLFILTAIALDVAGLKFDVWLPVVLSLAIASALLIYALRDAGKKKLGVAVALFIISSTYSVSFFYDFTSIGPTPEQQAYMHLLSKIRDVNGKIDPNWRDSSWNFLSPKCYSASVARKYGNTSLEMAVFSYRYSKTQYDPNRPIKILFTKLFCGYADSKTAYEKYKRALLNNGFKLEENNGSFLAENESLVVFCSRERELIAVVKVDKTELELLKAEIHDVEVM
ncbi:hypothetical protein Ferp_1212 [Ferroglobus placidus DSM 10642]|uniref:Uncharacterized protein n=1 Tax=Ferroglobus placidus (strain DSM 10642 / AEDII12DO) TaxID=589924 RepID=D3RY07_FERPA|nr:hypothetical protein [Ferroglobus placidus]ADC65370.1 hypothetical protein Ferp_1212 [Ferroglobus placidus DSM 10642]